MTFVAGRPRWWQWPTILSLDAAAVAIAWQALFGRVVEAPLRTHHVLLLGASVWMAYSADRWIEGWRLSENTVRTQRHFFAIRWRGPFLAVWLAVFAASLFLAGRSFGPREWAGSLFLLAPTLLYLLSHQLFHRDHPWRVPKEICVAALLTAGAALFPALLSPGRWRDLVVPGLLFFTLAMENCLLISEWEREVDRAQRQTSLALEHRLHRVLSPALLVSALFAGAFLALAGEGAVRRAGACGAASAAFLAVLSVAQGRLGRERARVLVDLALLTPALMLILP